MKMNLICTLIFGIFLFGSCKEEPEIPNEKLSQDIVDLRGMPLKNFPDKLLLNKECTQIYLGSKTFKKYPPNALMPDQTLELSEVPEEIGKLNNLRKLSITASELEFLPKSLSQLNNLKTLDISFNSKLDTATFASIIESIPNLDTIVLYRTFIPAIYKEKLWVTKPQLIIIDEFSNPEYTGLIISN